MVESTVSEGTDKKINQHGVLREPREKAPTLRAEEWIEASHVYRRKEIKLF